MPVGRLALERGVGGRDALGVDPPDLRPVVSGHRARSGSPSANDATSRSHRRTGTPQPGRATIGVRSAPRRSTRSTTSSPGSRYRPSVASRTSSRQPDPTVPLPTRSPGRRRASADARASISPNENCASDHRPATRLGPVDLGRHRQVVAGPGPRVRQLVGGDQPWTERAREVLALGRAEPDGGLLALEVTGRPVVEDRVATDRLLRPLGRQAERRRVHQGRDLQLVVELVRRGRAPDRLARPADLRHVAEVEDRQPVPGLGHLATATFPHRPDVAFEGVEVAHRRRPEDRRPEHELTGRLDGVVVLPARLESFDEVAQGVDPQAAREMVVEGRHRLAVERRIVREGGPRAHRASTRNLEVQPATRGLAWIERRRQTPRVRPRARAARGRARPSCREV